MFPFFTIGHSTRSVTEFICLLREAEIEVVVDVRAVPRSRTNPRYNSDALPEPLAECDIGYEHLAALGGLRPRSSNVPPYVNGLWQNQSFHNYADYAMSEKFRSGLVRLLDLGRNRRCAIMCAEAVWWRCHRRIITDYLLAAGAEVFHLLGRGHVDKAQMTPGAKINEAGALTYPAAISKEVFST
jgi:uncharacterized protein (DUF488 family)